MARKKQPEAESVNTAEVLAMVAQAGPYALLNQDPAQALIDDGFVKQVNLSPCPEGQLGVRLTQAGKRKLKEPQGAEQLVEDKPTDQE